MVVRSTSPLPSLSPMGKLFVVPTPIGNLKDITLRSLEVLKEVRVIVCEDTRRTLKLLNHYEIRGKKLISHYEPKERKTLPKILSILEEEDVALVTDAGMPAISDPGYLLIRECIERGIGVEVLPGPSALITALVGSGLPTDSFYFGGFLPRKGLKKFLLELDRFKDTTLLFFESPHRLLKTLSVMAEVIPSSQVCVARELSKVHEEYIRGTPRQIIEVFKGRGGVVKGEVVLVLRLEG